MVVRADTYHERSLSTRACMMLFDKVKSAAEGKPADNPQLRPLAPSDESDKPAHSLSAIALDRYACEIEMESGRKISVTAAGGALTIDYGRGTYFLRPESDTRFIAEDMEDAVLFDLAEDGRVNKIWVEQLCYLEATAAAKRGELNATLKWLRSAIEKFPESSRTHFNMAKVLQGTGKSSEALPHVRRALEIDPKNKGAADLLRTLQLRRFAWVIGIFALLAAWLVVRVVLYRRRRNRQALVAGSNASGITSPITSKSSDTFLEKR